MSAASFVAKELGFQTTEIDAALRRRPSSLRPDEQTLVDLVESVRESVRENGHAAGGATPDGGPPPLSLLTTLRAAYAFRRWTRLRESPMELPTEFLAAILQQMGIADAVDFDGFEKFVGSLRRSGAEDVRGVLAALKPYFPPGRSGGAEC